MNIIKSLLLGVVALVLTPCILASTTIIKSSPPAGYDDGYALITFPELGIRFVFPKAWEVKISDNDGVSKICKVRFTTTGWAAHVEQSDGNEVEYLVEIGIGYSSKSEAMENGWFSESDGIMDFNGGRMGNGEIEKEITGKNWKGYYGCGILGVYAKGGPYIGTGGQVCGLFITSANKQYVTILLASMEQSYNYDILIKTFEFIPKKGG